MAEAVEPVASVGTSDGRVLHVARSEGTVLIEDGGTTMPVADAGLMHDVLLRAADAEIGADRVRLIGTIGQVHVLRWPYAVTITDSPNPADHSGWTMRVDQARELGEALLTSATDTNTQ
jgi:hypothetical protein